MEKDFFICKLWNMLKSTIIKGFFIYLKRKKTQQEFFCSVWQRYLHATNFPAWKVIEIVITTDEKVIKLLFLNIKHNINDIIEICGNSFDVFNLFFVILLVAKNFWASILKIMYLCCLISLISDFEIQIHEQKVYQKLAFKS